MPYTKQQHGPPKFGPQERDRHGHQSERSFSFVFNGQTVPISAYDQAEANRLFERYCQVQERQGLCELLGIGPTLGRIAPADKQAQRREQRRQRRRKTP